LDTLTHALSGALLARATAPKDAPPRSIPRRVAAGFFAAAAPDLDFVLAFVSPVFYLEQHRGPTHSVLLLPLWALLLFRGLSLDPQALPSALIDQPLPAFSLPVLGRATRR
jgi:membrane-bound metal-dependent hydrolase YbcI (DUF457 family)